jgi:hypothetical protein
VSATENRTRSPSRSPGPDPPALGGELHGVADQVAEDLVDAVAVGVDERQVGLDLARRARSASRSPRAPWHAARLAQQRLHGLRPRLDGDVAGLHAGDLQQVLDQAVHLPGRAVDHLELLRAPGSSPSTVSSRNDPAGEDEVERVAQVVRDHRQHLVARAGGLLRLLRALRSASESERARSRISMRARSSGFSIGVMISSSTLRQTCRVIIFTSGPRGDQQHRQQDRLLALLALLDPLPEPVQRAAVHHAEVELLVEARRPGADEHLVAAGQLLRQELLVLLLVQQEQDARHQGSRRARRSTHSGVPVSTPRSPVSGAPTLTPDR